MSQYILALDQGTTSSRAIAFDRSGNIAALSQQSLPQHYPQAGWVEHDPLEIWDTQRRAAAEVIARLPEGSVSPEEFDDPAYRGLCEAMLDGESPAALMERQPDDEGRAVIGDILSINTDLDDEGLMQMAQDCLKKLRRERLEKEMDKLQKSLSTLPEEQRAAATQRAFQLAQQLTELR